MILLLAYFWGVQANICIFVYNYGVTHTGGIDDVSAFMFAKRGGLMTPKIVAYDGVGPMIANLIKGDIDVGVLNLAEAGGQIDAGEICPVVVMANERMAKIGDVPTAKELGIDASFSTVRGFVTLAGAPDDHADVLEEKMLKAMGHKYYHPNPHVTLQLTSPTSIFG